MHEKAIFGFLGGNFGPVIQLCATWQDLLWAYTADLLDYKIDEALR